MPKVHNYFHFFLGMDSVTSFLLLQQNFFIFSWIMENQPPRTPGRPKAPQTIEIQSKFIGSGGVRSDRKSQKSPKGHNFANFQLAQHWPRITLEPIQEYALRVNTIHDHAREHPGTSRGSPGTSAQQPLKTHKDHHFIDPGNNRIRIDFHLLLATFFSIFDF